MAREPRATEQSAFAPPVRDRRLKIVDGRTPRTRTWLLVLVLLLAGAGALLGLRLALDAMGDEPPPPPPVSAAGPASR